MVRRILVILTLLSLLVPSYHAVVWSVIAVVAPFESLLHKITLLLACAAYWWGVMIAWELSKHFFTSSRAPYRRNKVRGGLIALIGGIFALELLIGGDDKGLAPQGLMLSALVAPLLLGMLLKVAPNPARP